MDKQREIPISTEQGGETFDPNKLTLEQMEAVLEQAKKTLFEEGLRLKRPGGGEAYVEDGEDGCMTNGLSHLEQLITGRRDGFIDDLTERPRYPTPEAAMEFMREEARRMGYNIRKE